jgi:diaminohydroxyphosphoribosylaminopyrimidine deaminase/5-amino-6-(5-phosphoribosylamino)uracil reductase
MSSGESKWITGDLARADVQLLRAQSCAIVTSVETVIKDDPSLNVRSQDIGGCVLTGGSLDETRQPLRVIVDSKLRTPGTSKLFSLPGSITVFTALSEIAGDKNNLPDDVDVQIAENSGQQVNLQSVLKSLATKYFCNEILVEAGPTLSGAFIAAGLVDELVIYVAGKFMGNEAMPLLNLAGLEKMSDAIEIEIKDISRIENDFRVTASPKNTAEA